VYGSAAGLPRPSSDFDERWVQQHEGQTLPELQLEAAERGLKWLKAAEGKVFPLFASTLEPQRVKAVENVEKLIVRLKAGDKVTRSRSFFDRFGKDQGK